MRVLAIDPGYGRCGVAVLEKENGKERVVYSACIETSKKLHFPARLASIANKSAALIKKYKPDAVALEKLYFSTNQKTAMQVAEVRGALISLSSTHRLPVFEYTPGQVKSATAGSGSADKHQIAKMLHALIAIEKKIKYDDEYDAIAIGVTHFAYVRPTRIGTSEQTR